MNYKKIINFKDIERILKKHKIKNQKIVHCHGVFDLLHIGHLKHFETAKNKGDILIVSITDDQYIDKGFNRPFFKNQQRLESLSSIEDITYVVLNNSSTAVNIISKIKPDFYCKGPDYKKQKDDITGQIKNEINAVKKFGGKIVITNDTTYSSSSILNDVASPFDLNQKKFLKKIKTDTNLFKFSSQIKKLEKLKVLIIGETIIDKYIFCEALGKSGKEPHLVLRDLYEESYLGGVIAIARNASSFCKKITVLSCLGKDKKLNLIKKKLSKNISFKYLIKSNSPTIIKKRYIEHISKSKVLGVYSLNDELLNLSEESKFIKMVSNEIKKYDVVIVSDYGHGLITDRVAKLINKNAKFLALNAQANAANVGYHTIQKYKNVDCVVMNEQELRQELRNKNEKVENLAKKLSKILNIKNLVITQGSKGAFLYDSKTRLFFYSPAFASKVVDKVGAGDTMLSIISLLIKLKSHPILSLFLGSLAGAISVEELSNKVPLNKTKLFKYMEHILK
jgi:rfaE bifunctional protein kinase chain/domain/rfaE bifunctional protein nucleotidyltransferase chain/domain